MQRTLVTLAILSLVTHVTLGCCWHHAHLCADECCETPSASAAACESRHHGHSDELLESPNQRDVASSVFNMPALTMVIRSSDCGHSAHSCGDGRCVSSPRPPRGKSNPQGDVRIAAVELAVSHPRVASDFAREGSDSPQAILFEFAPHFCVWRL